LTYTTLDADLDSGDPFFLYEFNRGTDTWRYTSYPTTIEDATLGTFSPRAISHTNVTSTGTIERLSLEINLPFTDALAIDQRVPNYYQITTVTIWRYMYSAASEPFAVMWKGRVISHRTSNRQFTLVCENVHTSIRRSGLRGRFQRTCRHNLYGGGCGLNIADWQDDTTVVSITDNSVVVNEIADKTNVAGYYSGGIMQFGTEYAFIEQGYSSNRLRMMTVPKDLEVGSTVTLAPGCSLTRSVCESKFDNVINFGGVPYLPTRNPFGGNGGQPLT